MPASDGLGQFYNGKWSPFSHVSITGGNYASPPHKDKKDVRMNFIIWYLLGVMCCPLLCYLPHVESAKMSGAIQHRCKARVNTQCCHLQNIHNLRAALHDTATPPARRFSCCRLRYSPHDTLNFVYSLHFSWAPHTQAHHISP